MALQDLLILDHFLYTFSLPVFKRLKALCSLLKKCEYRQIVRPDARYDGVYLIAQDGSYFEMLRHEEQTPNIFSLAMASLSPTQDTVRLLPSRYSDLNWFTQKIHDSEDKPWYTYYGQIPITEIHRQGLIMWAMLYHNLRRHQPYQYQKKPPSTKDFTIKEFTAARIQIPPSYLDLIRVQSQWVPGNHTISDQKVILRLLNPSFNEFEVSLEVDAEKAQSRPISISMQLVKEAPIESQQIKGIHLTRLQDKLIINF
ncbi:MAG: hypothetical protein ACFFDU_05585 [Candidatus Thorarchaeota archaeon]